jgi:hypothetical protein
MGTLPTAETQPDIGQPNQFVHQAQVGHPDEPPRIQPVRGSVDGTFHGTGPARKTQVDFGLDGPIDPSTIQRMRMNGGIHGVSFPARLPLVSIFIVRSASPFVVSLIHNAHSCK